MCDKDAKKLRNIISTFNLKQIRKPLHWIISIQQFSAENPYKIMSVLYPASEKQDLQKIETKVEGL